MVPGSIWMRDWVNTLHKNYLKSSPQHPGLMISNTAVRMVCEREHGMNVCVSVCVFVLCGGCNGKFS